MGDDKCTYKAVKDPYPHYPNIKCIWLTDCGHITEVFHWSCKVCRKPTTVEDQGYITTKEGE